MKIGNIKKWGLSMMCLMLLGCASSRSYTVDENVTRSDASGAVTLEIKEVALGIGHTKGEGILTYQGEEYPFRLSGIDYGSISKVVMQTSGNAYHLNKLSHFEGIYFQARLALTVGQTGKSGMFLVNRHGVTLYLASDQRSGFDLALGRAGVKIKFLDKE